MAENYEELNKIIEIYEEVLSRFLSGTKKTVKDLKPYLDKAFEVSKKFKHLSNLRIEKKTGRVKLNITVFPARDELIVSLNELLDGFIDVSIIEFDILSAQKDAEDVVRKCLAEFGEWPQKLGIVTTILQGSLVKKISLGIPPVDEILKGSLVSGLQILLIMETSPERDAVLRAFLFSDLGGKDNFIAVVSDREPQAFIEEVERTGIKVSDFIRAGRIKIVDWFSHKKEKVVSVSESDSIVRAPKDPAKVLTALKRVIASMGPKGRMTLDVSELVVTSSLEKAIDTITPLTKMLKNSGYTLLATLDPKVHDSNVISRVSSAFDGVMRFERIRENIIQAEVESIREKKKPGKTVFEIKGRTFVPLPVEKFLSEETEEYEKPLSPEEEIKLREEFREIMELWRMGGYNIRRLKSVEDASIPIMQRELRRFEEDVLKLRALKDRYTALKPGITGRDLGEIEKMFFDVDLLPEVEKIIKEIEAQGMVVSELKKEKPPEEKGHEILFSKGLTCPECGAPLDGLSLICGKCGLGFGPPEGSFRCPGCDTEIQESDEICPKCGRRFDRSEIYEALLDRIAIHEIERDLIPAEGEIEKEQIVCPACGSNVDYDLQRCPLCGSSLITAQKEVEAEEEEIEIPEELEKSIKEMIEEKPKEVVEEKPPHEEKPAEVIVKPLEATELLNHKKKARVANGRAAGLINARRAGKGRINGRVVKEGRINGRAERRKRIARMKRVRGASIIAGMVVLIVVITGVLFLMYPAPATRIRVDGDLGDWHGIPRFTDPGDSAGGTDILEYGVFVEETSTSFFARFAGKAMGEGAVRSLDIFLDRDDNILTGYRIAGMGADLRISVTGVNGRITETGVYRYELSDDQLNYTSWVSAGDAKSAVKDDTLEVQMQTASKEISSGFRGVMVSRDSSGHTDVTDGYLCASGRSLVVVQEDISGGIIPSGKSDVMKVTFTAPGAKVYANITLPPGFTASQTSIQVLPGSSTAITLQYNTTGGDGEPMTYDLSRKDILVADDVAVRIIGTGVRAYLGKIPSEVRIDGVFSDWLWSEIRNSSETPDLPANIDILSTGYTNRSIGGSSSFLLRVRGDSLGGDSVPGIPKVVSGGGGGGGGIVLPRTTGEDSTTIYIDSEPGGGCTGMPGADSRIVIRGIEGTVTSRTFEMCEGSRWNKTSYTVSASASSHSLEASIPVQLPAGTKIYFVTTDWSGKQDEADRLYGGGIIPFDTPPVVVINEVKFGGSGSDWIELYAHAETPIGGWIITNEDSFTYTISSITLTSGCYLVIHLSPGTDEVDCTDARADVYTKGGDLGDVDVLSLYNSQSTIVDFVAWGGDPGGKDTNAVKAGIWTDNAYVPTGGLLVAGESIARCPNGQDTNSVSDWTYSLPLTEGGNNEPEFSDNVIPVPPLCVPAPHPLPEFSDILLPLAGMIIAVSVIMRRRRRVTN